MQNLTVPFRNSFDCDDAIAAFRTAQDRLVHQEGHSAETKLQFTLYTERAIKCLKNEDLDSLEKLMHETASLVPDVAAKVHDFVFVDLGLTETIDFFRKYVPS